MPGTLTRWEPFAEFGELRSRFDRMFDDFTFGRERTWTPAIDVMRENGNLIVRANIPGIKAETHDGVVEVTIPLPKEGKKGTVTITPTAV